MDHKTTPGDGILLRKLGPAVRQIMFSGFDRCFNVQGVLSGLDPWKSLRLTAYSLIKIPWFHGGDAGDAVHSAST